MNRIKAAFMSLVSALKPAHYNNGAPRARSSDGKKDRSKNKKGAYHIVGKPFRPRNLSGMSPAKYRRTHQKNPAKWVYEKMRLETRKWISA